MRAAHRLHGMGWLLSCVVVVLCCYMVSLSVAAERNKLAGVNARIARANRDLRALETEFNTRANLAQLERWNGEVLALSAPVAAQFIAGERQFAQLAQAGPGAAVVQTAALITPAAPAAIQPRPVGIETAALTPPPVSNEAVAQEAPIVEQAAVAVRSAAGAKKAQAMAMLDRKLLSDATLGDLMSGARREAGLR